MCQGVMVTVIFDFFETEPCCWIRIGLCTNYAGSCNEKAIDRYHRRWGGYDGGADKDLFVGMVRDEMSPALRGE